MNETMTYKLGLTLGELFNNVKEYKLNDRDFIKQLLKSSKFKYMLKNCGHRYWTHGEGYAITDFIKNHNIKKQSSEFKRPLYDIESKWLGETVMTLVEDYNIDQNSIADNLDNILKYTEFIDYHSPEEIIQKCNLIKSSEIKSQYK